MKKPKIKIGLEITHRCNRMCGLCSHRIKTSPYDFLTKEQYHHIVECLGNFRVTEIMLLGGEPLEHPHIHWLIDRLKTDFPDTLLHMVTNGDSLGTLSEEEIGSFFKIVISLYDERSEQTRQAFKRYPNVYFLDMHRMLDPAVDPDLDDAAARECCRICSRTGIRLVGTKVYGCCLAEVIEREFDIGPLHIEMQPGWYEEYLKLPTYQACRHCFRAREIKFNRSYRRMEHIIRVFKNNDWIYNTYNSCKAAVKRIRCSLLAKDNPLV